VLVAVLDLYKDLLYPALLLPAWKGVDDPIERIFALLGRYRELLRVSACTYGCPIGSIALELHEPDPPVRERLAANFEGWVRAVEHCLIEAGDRVPAGVDRGALARLVLATMEGAVMQARTYRTLEAFDAAVGALRDYFERLAPRPVPGGRGRVKRG